MTFRIGLFSYGLQTGGVSTFLIRLARQLQSKGHSVWITTTGSPGPWNDVAKHIPDVRTTHLPVTIPLASAYTQSIATWIDAARLDCLLLNHSKWAQLSLPLLHTHPVVIPIVHNDEPDVCSTAVSLAGYWDCVVAVSPRVHDRVVSLLGSPDHVKLIVNGVPIPEQAQVAMRAPHSAPLQLVFVGNLVDQQKGVLLLPEIAAGCRDRGVSFKLTIVGRGPDRPKLERRAKALGIEDRVIFAGVLHPDSVYKTLLRSHILIHPTRFEGMPLAVLEAMSCGCVPVVSSLPGITDLAVADGVSGILAESAKPSSFVDAVTGLASSPEKWSAMSHEAAVRTRGHFSVEHNAAQYDDLIRQTVSGPRGRGSMRECKPVPLTWRNHLRLLTDCAYGRFRS